MKGLGRIICLLSSIITGLWLAFTGLGVVVALKRPDAVSAAMGYALFPLLLFIISVWCFRRLAPETE
jgi:amino acid permease